MKKIILLFALSFSMMGFAQFSVPTASPRQTVEQQFSLSKITVDYGRPGVKGRKIFGDLVPFGKVWRAGANSSTKITFGQNVNFGGKEVMAGTYGLFVIPTEKDWKIILNKDAQQWGAYTYDEKLNVIDVTVPAQKSSEKQEWFEIALNPVDAHSIDLVLSWDMTKATVNIKEAKPEVVGQIIEKLNEINKIQRDAAAKK
ncbi:hypothetical protein OA84_09375 [Kaistella solincola]|uniref:DUF2911 domain-containing protein n=1 Tax=Kaistella solincola TaxID=510955 RepID=A0ABR4ZSD5_9FLAO|nr:DUF2911 domain-containing protein [Kaistella solincola]KIA83681.1 hypothetical protein OA84_09375 [Kaistella solincola]